MFCLFNKKIKLNFAKKLASYEGSAVYRVVKNSHFSTARRGFTVIELVVVIAIFIIITGIVVADIPSFQNKSSLDLTVSEVATYIRGAQVYGAVQKDTPSGVGKSVYGISLTQGASEFYLFQNDKAPLPHKENYVIKGFDIAKICQKSTGGTVDSSASSLDIVYTPSNYEVNIGTAVGAIFYSNFDADNPDDNKMSGIEYVDIKISNKRNPTLPGCVRVYSNGQVAITNCDGC